MEVVVDNSNMSEQITKLSRSAIEQYLNCKRCFVLAYRYKVRPFMLPFTLNSGVDQLAKNEFDHYRSKQEPHPMFEEHGIDAIPFNHPDLDDWRNNFKGVRYLDKEKGYEFFGAIDDLWVTPDEKLIISDTKATCKNVFDWEQTWQQYDYPKAYKRQLECYQFLLRKNGFEVLPDAYLVYYNGKKNEPFFNQRMEFDLHLIKIENCSDDWVEPAILEAKECLSGEMPQPATKCENCNYLRKRWEVANKNMEDM